MTRRHFEALAGALRSRKPAEADDDDARSRRSQWDDDVVAIAHVGRAFNPNFDLDRFLVAAGFRGKDS